MDYLTCALDELDGGVATIEAMASAPAAQHTAVMADVQQVLGWAWHRFPGTHGPIGDGMAWAHDGGWQIGVHAAIDAAGQCHTDPLCGSLERGKAADLVVLDAEPTKVAPQDIAQIPVPSTWLDGERRFAA